MSEEILLTNKGILLLNPGSVTGAWSFVASRIPTFIELDINIDIYTINIFLFQLDKKLNSINELESRFIFKQNKIQNND